MERHQVTLITGAAGDIGSAIAQSLASENRSMILTYHRREDETLDLAQRIRSRVRSTWVTRLDLREQGSVERLFDEIASRHGGCDILVNNAGITADRTAAKMTDEEWNSVLEVNLTGTFQCCRAAIPAMSRQRWGRIVNISSLMAQVPSHGQTNYCASKAGILGFTRSLAAEVAPKGITVNAVTPGYIQTSLTDAIIQDRHRDAIREKIPMKRFGTPEEVADAVRFLVNGASYVTGTSVNVNGGCFL